MSSQNDQEKTHTHITNVIKEGHVIIRPHKQKRIVSE